MVFLYWGCFSAAGQFSWTLPPGSMELCSTASALWQTSHRFSIRRDFLHYSHKQMCPHCPVMVPQKCQILDTKREKTHFCSLHISPSALLMTFKSGLTVPAMHPPKIVERNYLFRFPVLHYSVTSTHSHCDSPLSLTGLASWSSTTSWTLPLCFQS